MAPTTGFCPNGPCPARGQTGMGNSGIHAQKAQRFLCHACHKTFSARTGTVF
jgi:transposase-like protein